MDKKKNISIIIEKKKFKNKIKNKKFNKHTKYNEINKINKINKINENIKIIIYDLNYVIRNFFLFINKYKFLLFLIIIFSILHFNKYT